MIRWLCVNLIAIALILIDLHVFFAYKTLFFDSCLFIKAYLLSIGLDLSSN